MTALQSAKNHLRKAGLLLQAGVDNFESELYDGAVSNAVTSGINSKDAICFKRSGFSRKSDDHAAALGELDSAGPDARRLAPTFRRLLSKKSKAQYQEQSVTGREAKEAIAQAAKLYEAAQKIVAS